MGTRGRRLPRSRSRRDRGGAPGCPRGCCGAPCPRGLMGAARSPPEICARPLCWALSGRVAATEPLWFNPGSAQLLAPCLQVSEQALESQVRGRGDGDAVRWCPVHPNLAWGRHSHGGLRLINKLHVVFPAYFVCSNHLKVSIVR